MSSGTPLLPLMFSSACTGKQAVPEDAVGTDEEVLAQGARQEMRKLLLYDATPNQKPDLAEIAGPYFELVVAPQPDELEDKTAAALGIRSWGDFDRVLAGYSSIDTLYLSIHGDSKELLIGGEGRSPAALTGVMAASGMPQVVDMVLDGCLMGLAVRDMLGLAQAMQLNSLKAWPLFLGLTFESTAPLSREQVAARFADNEGYLLGGTVDDAIRLGKIVYAWLQTKNEDRAYPTDSEIPEAFAGAAADYRAQEGFYQADKAQPAIVLRSWEPTSIEVTAIEQTLWNDYNELEKRPAEPYDHLKFLYIV